MVSLYAPASTAPPLSAASRRPYTVRVSLVGDAHAATDASNGDADRGDRASPQTAA
jgi:hypothetical protein